MSRDPYVSLNFVASQPSRSISQSDIVEQLASDISSGRLRPGMRLPPVRALEHQLGISKNTVQAAYDELTARGLLHGRERQGVFVAARSEGNGVAQMFSAPAARFRTLDVPPPKHVHVDHLELSNVFIDPELLPHRQLSDCFRSVLASPGLHTFYDSQGHPGLRAAIAERLQGRGIDADPEDVIVTTGSQQALDIVARALDRKVIATENPVYFLARQLFLSVGCQTHPLRIDPFSGIDFDEWEGVLAKQRPSLVYVIPNYQNPTGYSYSTPELEKLLALSEKYGFAILEDDWGSDMLSCSEYRPTLRALAGKNVLYVNSFTKKLLPSLRLGYLVCSPDARQVLVSAKRISTLGNATLMEATLHEFVTRGYYDTHLRRIHGVLDQRYLSCLQLLRDLMPRGVRFSTPGGGPTLWLELPAGVQAAELRARLERRGVYIELCDGHFSGTPHLNGFRVGFAFLSTDRLRLALTALAEELERLLPDLPSTPPSNDELAACNDARAAADLDARLRA